MPDRVAAVLGVRQAERFAKDLRRRADRPRLIAPLLHLDLDTPSKVAERLLAHGGDDGVDERRSQFRSFSADDEQLWIQDGHHVRDGLSERRTGVLHDRPCHLIALTDQRDEFGPRDVVSETFAHAPSQGALADDRLEAAETSALTLGATGFDDDVTELAGGPIGPW